MKQLLSLIRTGAPMMLLSVLSLVLLQACELLHTEVIVDCGANKAMGNNGVGTTCQKLNVALHSAVQPNSVAVDSSTPPKLSGQTIPANSKCDWTGGQNKKCAAPGTPNCNLDPNATCHDTYNLSTKRCDCLCL